MILSICLALLLAALSRSLEDLYPRQISIFLKVCYPGINAELSYKGLTILRSPIVVCSTLRYSLIVTCVKLSLWLQYRRAFDTSSFRKRSLIVGIPYIAWWLSTVVEISIAILHCPIFAAGFELASVFTKRYIILRNYNFGIVASSLCLEILLLGLLLTMVWRLKLPMKQKITSLGIFSMGFL